MELENGTTIQTIEKYNLKHTFENNVLPVIEIDGADITSRTCAVQAGVHLFELTSVVLGLESRPSNTASALIEPDAIPEPSLPQPITLTILVRVSNESDNIAATVEIVE